MKKVFLIILLLFTGCALHLERGNKPIPEYFEKINQKCEAEKIIVILKNKETEEGLFVKIDENVLAIVQEGKIVEYPTMDVAKIKYNRGFSPNGMVLGMAAGFFAGIIPAVIVSPELGGAFGRGTDHGASLLFIPAGTVAGGIWGGLEFDKYNTISLVR